MAGHAGKMDQAQALVIIAAELGLFLRAGRRGAQMAVDLDGTSSLGHGAHSKRLEQIIDSAVRAVSTSLQR